jgi:hypothetical protein
MPVYTARVNIFRNKKFQEEIWLENIRASGQTAAQNKAATQAHNYMQLQKGEPQAPDGYDILFCCRTALVGDRKPMDVNNRIVCPPEPRPSRSERKHRGRYVHAANLAQRALALPHVKQPPKPPFTINEKKFKAELKGSFNDIFSFHKPLLVRVHTPIQSNRPAWFGYY